MKKVAEYRIINKPLLHVLVFCEKQEVTDLWAPGLNTEDMMAVVTVMVGG